MANSFIAVFQRTAPNSNTTLKQYFCFGDSKGIAFGRAEDIFCL